MSFMTNRPVRGQDFFGRQSILKEIQKRVGRPTWVLGNRRVGKSSLLRQIEWLCDQKHWAGIHALYWDFQGAGSSEGLKESLLECLESKSQILDAFDLDIDDLEKYSFPELLTKIRRRFKGKGQFVFLIDEVEELVDISQREPQTLGALRKIQEPGSLSLIITGSRRLMELDESGALTSPLLPDFLPPLLLGPFQETETQQMLAAGKIPQETAHQIHQLTFGNPHLTNHLAERYLQLGSLDLATKSIMQDKVLNYFFQSNFSCLPHRYMEAWRSRKSTDLLQSIVPAHRDFPYLQQSVLIRAISESSVEVNPLLQLEEAG
ncbi:MAG: hypothetical protein KDC71_03425 [Acidobacteria bacterium]|nr:hypothetical protein [Acidobacteriota bacterium]